MKRRLFQGYIFGVLFAITAIADCLASQDAMEHSLPHSDNLVQLAERSRQEGIPILVMFSTLSCDYCKRLEQDVLGPMQVSEEQSLQVIIAKVESGGGNILADFSGKRVSAETFTDAYEVEVFPTVALLNAEGEVLVPNIVGYQTPEFYGAYLDAAISAARQIMRGHPAR